MKKIIMLSLILLVGVFAFAETRYLVTFEVSQSHLTLSLSQMMSDSMNKASFEVPVDRKYYDSVSIDEDVMDDFRTGSLLLHGSLGSNKVTIVNKRIVEN